MTSLRPEKSSEMKKEMRSIMSWQFQHRKSLLHRSLGATMCMVAGLWGGAAGAADLVEPAVFASSNGVLDILMIAKTSPVPNLAFTPPDGSGAVNPTGWVYEICKRKGSETSCPAGSGTVADYGGVRLALNQGDVLKVRLVNKLPLITAGKLKHVGDPGQANLFLNPTNLHTHGLLTPARAATLKDPTFGDFAFVSVYNSANGIPVPQTTHQHGPIVMDSVDYKIPIPWNHPTGLFWFHPHIHGLSLNQVTEGMAGIITIGRAGDNIRGDAARTPWPEASVRHLLLKDTMVLAGGTIGFDSGDQTVVNGEILNQQDPNFCTQFPESATENRRGGCPGADNSQDPDPGNNYTGGRWFYTVNGQQFPTIRITDPDGEVWRLTNASASLSYDLKLVDDTTQKPLVMQLVAVDGVSIHLPQDTTMDSVVTLAGARFKVVKCPPVPGGVLRSLPVCVSELVMMPSSRAEIWVTYRDQNGRVTAPPSTGATATLKQVGLTMGSGDTWPAIDLASVVFTAAHTRKLTSYALDIQGDAFNSTQPNGIFAGKVPDTDKATTQAANCKPLPAGHHRRIFFGFSDVTIADTFALGYEEVDRNGAVVAGTQRPLTQFDPSQPTVCLPLGPGQTPVHETWELVQLSTENHNFHIHQARFRQVRTSAAANSIVAERPYSFGGGGIFLDNLALGVAEPTQAILDTVTNDQNGVCTVDQWRAGTCKSAPVVVDIPFSQLGEFIYHCHILEHEDGGMMAGIKVVPYSGPGWSGPGGGWPHWWFSQR
jgi:FtsP/CotA-like multicopper oxidase with cupredoxin domain